MYILFTAVHNTTLLVIFDTEFIFATYLHGMIVNLVCFSIILYVQLIKWLGMLQFFTSDSFFNYSLSGKEKSLRIEVL